MISTSGFANESINTQSNSDTLYYQEHALILDIAQTSDRIIAVGEHGLILYSNNMAESWLLAVSSTDVLLTSVFFLNQNKGWITGHHGTILYTNDGGLNWHIQHANLKSDPLFDILFINEKQGIAIGAYGSYLTTNDGGENWRRSKIIDDDFHLYAITSTIDNTFYIAGESGILLKSVDFNTWQKMTIPYEGTLLTLISGKNAASGKKHITAAGLRGNIIQSTNDGLNWKLISSETIAPLQGGTSLKNGKLIFGGSGGSLVVSNSPNEKFHRIFFPINYSISKIIQISDTDLLISGSFGLRKTHINISIFN